MKRILVTGENSYIGTSFVTYMEQFKEEYEIETISVRGNEWRRKDFSIYDAVFHVAGIAHADVGKVSDEEKELYYKVNTDLTFEVANKYKSDRTNQFSQFVHMSSIIVYGDNVSIRKKRVITKDTEPKPSNFYGDSKLQGEIKIKPLADTNFNICIIRPPMIYGPNSKGNYPQLRKLALKLPIFPDIPNERSMLYVGNLMNFVKEMVDSEKETGIYFPQNSEYVRTSHMVKEIAKAHGKDIKLFSFMNWSVYLLSYIPGKIGDMTNKAFGNLVYNKEIISYSEKKFKETIFLTEAKCKSKKKVLFIVNHDLVIYNFRKELVFELIRQGYEVNILSPPGEKIEKLKKAGCTIHNLEINRRGANIFEELQLIKRIYSSIKEINPDVVLTFTIKPNIYGAVISKVLKKPCISNVTGIGTSIYSKKLTAKILRQIYVKSLNTCSNIFFQNESNKELFIDAGLKKENIYLLPGSGVNLAEFKTLEFPKNDKIRLLYLARIMKDKGINEYIESAKLIKNVKKKENVEFLVAGFIDGDYEGMIKTEENSGVITYLGEIEDVPKLLLTTHCVILPSYHEGMSNVLLEASASGRPVLASNIPGCKEIIDNNKSGFLFEPKNSTSLENAILKFLRLTNEEMEEYGLNGRIKMENEFDRKIVVKKYLIKIKELIK